MKKVMSFVLVLVMCLLLCACGVSSNAANDFVARIDDEAFNPTSISSGERDRMFEADTFKEAVITKINNDIGIKKTCNFLAKLESMDYKNPDVQSAFADVLENYLTELLSSDDNINQISEYVSALALLPDDSFYYQAEEKFISTVCSLISNNQLTLLRGSGPIENETGKLLVLSNELDRYEYYNETIKAELQSVIQKNIAEWSSDSIVRFVDDVQFWGGENYYFSVIDFFPYDVVKTLAESEGKVLSLVDGYYSENMSEYENVHYWKDPLDNKKYSSGGVGLFEMTIQYTPYGDFMYRDYKYIAYGSSGNGRGDEKELALWLRWQFSGDDNKYNITLFESKDNINTFLNIAKRGNIYCFENSHKELLIAVIEKSMITFVVEDRGVIFSVSYS